jgi:hypothetical protein
MVPRAEFEVPHRRTAGVLQGCYKGVTRVSQGCYTGVTRVLQGCYKGFTNMLQVWCKDVTSVFQVCFKGVTRVLQGCYLLSMSCPGHFHMCLEPAASTTYGAILRYVCYVFNELYEELE